MFISVAVENKFAGPLESLFKQGIELFTQSSLFKCLFPL